MLGIDARAAIARFSPLIRADWTISTSLVTVETSFMRGLWKSSGAGVCQLVSDAVTHMRKRQCRMRVGKTSVNGGPVKGHRSGPWRRQ
jgi:hypothetical protein